MASFSNAAFDVGAFAETAFDFGTAPVPVVEEELKGGRRIYDPDDRKRKHRKLNKREREDLDRMFRERVAPRYVEPKPEPPKPVKRETPYVAPRVVDAPKVPDRIVAAKQFMALDALDDLLAELERDREANARAVEVQHIRAKQHARFLEQEQQRLANEAVAFELARVEAVRVLEEERLAAIEAFRLAEVQRIEQEQEDEVIFLLLKVHLGEIG